MATLSRLLKVLVEILRPLPGVWDGITVIVILLLLLGVPAAVAGWVEHGGADLVTSISWGLVSLFGVLFLLAGAAIYRLQGRIETHVESTPKLEFGQPEPSSEVISVRGASAPISAVSVSQAAREGQIPCLLWRVDLSNVVDGTKASNVNVELTASDPKLPVLPVKLHEKHNDVRPYRQNRPIRHGEPVTFDVIGKATRKDGLFLDGLFLWRSDNPEETGYAYHLSPDERKIIDKKLKTTGMTITLTAVSDPPVKVVKQTYRLVIDGRGQLLMELIEQG